VSVSVAEWRNKQGSEPRDGDTSASVNCKLSDCNGIHLGAEQLPTTKSDAKRREAVRVSKRAGVDLWIASVPEYGALRDCVDMLSDKELSCYRRLHLDADRARFLNSHLLLRRGLSYAVDQTVPLSQWHYEKDIHGKPCVAMGLPRLHFNISDEARVSAVAISATRAVGVDVEAVTGNSSHRVVTSALSSREHTSINSVPARARFASFARLWAIKEAYAKMTGQGMALNLQGIEGSLITGNGFMYPDKSTKEHERACVEMRTVDLLDDEYCIALAVACAGGKIATVLHLVDHDGPGAKLRLVTRAVANSTTSRIQE